MGAESSGQILAELFTAQLARVHDRRSAVRVQGNALLLACLPLLSLNIALLVFCTREMPFEVMVVVCTLACLSLTCVLWTVLVITVAARPGAVGEVDPDSLALRLEDPHWNADADDTRREVARLLLDNLAQEQGRVTEMGETIRRAYGAAMAAAVLIIGAAIVTWLTCTFAPA